MTPHHILRECPLCGGAVVAFSGDIRIRIGKRAVTVHSDHEKCTGCGEGFYAPGQLEALEQRAAAAIRDEDGVLSPGEIRALREEMGLSQAGLEQLLGVGAKTVVRWERGTVVPNRATDNLLRTIQAVPAAARYLRARSERPRRPLTPAFRAGGT